MSVRVTVGDARVELGCIETVNLGSVLSQTYDFDALLHAVQRVAAAVLVEDRAALAQRRLSALRLALREAGL